MEVTNLEATGAMKNLHLESYTWHKKDSKLKSQ
jgi:hypothetical protein